jgi:hypothetical protein
LTLTFLRRTKTSPRFTELRAGTKLGFDNMSDHAVKGTTDWKMYSVVLDVPDDAKNIFLGALRD